MLSPLKFVAVLAAVGAAVGFAFSRVAGEYAISFQDWEWRNVDDVTAMIVGAIIGGAAGLVWGLVRKPDVR
jgi:hypothetical protein